LLPGRAETSGLCIQRFLIKMLLLVGCCGVEAGGGHGWYTGKKAHVKPSTGFRGNDSRMGVWRNGRIEPLEPADWPEGMRFRLLPLPPAAPIAGSSLFVVIAGFGLPGRYIAELLEEWSVPFCVLDLNPQTIRTQLALGRRAVQGDASKAEALRAAGLAEANVLALTIPEQAAVEKACLAARTIKPDVRIVARVAYASRGMRVLRQGADEVIIAEQEVATRFYDRLATWLTDELSGALTTCAGGHAPE